MLGVPIKCPLLLSPPPPPFPKQTRKSCMYTYSHLWLCYCRGRYALHLQCISLTTADFFLDSRHVRGIISWYSLSYLVVLKQTKSFYRAQWQSGRADLTWKSPSSNVHRLSSQSLNANSGSDNINKHFTRYSFQISWLSQHFTLRWIISEANTDSLSRLCNNHQEVVLKSISTCSFLAVSPFCYSAEKGHA